jgi:hypothetical protein
VSLVLVVPPAGEAIPDQLPSAALTVARAAPAGIRWDDADAVGIVVAVAPDGLMNQKGRAKDLAPLDLTDEPDIVALIGSIDLGDFAGV